MRFFLLDHLLSNRFIHHLESTCSFCLSSHNCLLIYIGPTCSFCLSSHNRLLIYIGPTYSFCLSSHNRLLIYPGPTCSFCLSSHNRLLIYLGPTCSFCLSSHNRLLIYLGPTYSFYLSCHNYFFQYLRPTFLCKHKFELGSSCITKKSLTESYLSRTNNLYPRCHLEFVNNHTLCRIPLISPATDACLTSQYTRFLSSIFPCALRGPFDVLFPACFSASQALCRGVKRRYLHFIGLTY